MRIEQVRFCNLNSLVGEWLVDFTCPDYTAEGLFAITGPTGAGKSTILDAICLALYGRTPRLGVVSAADNEIMSRQTGHCSAEVTFSTRRGKYRCSWHQRRARNRPDGALQPIERRFIDAATDVVLEQQAAGIRKAVEAATGMDFDRFTRSVLLAQGGFAAFLFAEPEQRSRILESLTGTAVYRDISCHVHVRHSEEKRRLENLHNRLQGISLLTQDDEERLRVDLASRRQQEVAARAELAGVEKALHRLRGLEQLRAEHARLEVQKTALMARHTAFEPQRLALRRAEKAQGLGPAFTELALVDKAQNEARLCCEQGRAAVPAQEQAVQQAATARTAAAMAADTARKAHETALPALREAGKLDALLAEKDARLRNEETALAAAQQTFDTLQTAHAAHLQERETVRAGLDEVQRQMEAHAGDRALVASLTGLEERFANVRRLHNQLQTGRKAEQQARQAAALETAQLAAQAAGVTALQTVESEARARLEARQTAVAVGLQGRELSAWRDELARLLEARTHLLAAQEQFGRRTAGAAKRRELQAAGAVLAAGLQARQTLITEREGRHKALLAEFGELEKEADRLRTVADLAVHRAQLEDGRACPLCGALHHPFAGSGVPAADGLPERLSAARAGHERLRSELENLRIEQAKDSRGLQENTARQEEAAALDAELAARLGQLSSVSCADLDLTQTGAEALVAARLAETETALTAVKALLDKVEVDEKALPSLRNALQVAADKAAQARLDHAACVQKHAAAQHDCTRLATENTAMAEALQGLVYSLEAEVLPFGEEVVSVELLDSVLNRLRTRRERWQGLAAQDVAGQQQLAALDALLAQEDARLRSETAQLHSRRELLQALAAERRSLHEQRVGCFAGADPAGEEARLAGLADETEKSLRAADATFAAAGQALGALQAELARLQTEMTARAAQLAALQEAFSARLRLAGFADQAEFTAACLAEDVLQRLTREERALDDALTGLEAGLARITTQIAGQQAEIRDDSTVPELEAAQQGLQETLTRLLNELGALDQILKADAEARVRHGALLGEVTLQQAECGRWAELNALIGSADGKKYSKFAQGITFEIMLEHANRQLQAMKDRYLLVRDEKEPLALNVVDSFQAGEVRPTANLSGGESFLVSLALALGLSRMASQNVRVDSLFLDEGFGSLDEDALETALSTISSLREEGKLIGLISHVPSIKERVGVQIVVTPGTGGRSRLEGPGVSGGL